jgi:hypothetical protein
VAVQNKHGSTKVKWQGILVWSQGFHGFGVEGYFSTILCKIKGSWPYQREFIFIPKNEKRKGLLCRPFHQKYYDFLSNGLSLEIRAERSAIYCFCNIQKVPLPARWQLKNPLSSAYVVFHFRHFQ